MSTKIEWTDETWNPVVGCSKVSEGCRNCYAEGVAKRFGFTPKEWTAANAKENVTLHHDRINQPFRWKRPRRIFVNSMSDLFHEEVPEDFIIMLIRMVIEKTPQHIYQVLTKRPARMLEVLKHAGELPKNLWLGVSVEDQRTADERIPLLLQVPVAVRFLSCEPLLGQIDISKPGMGLHCESCCHRAAHWCVDPVIHWVIVGGESGPGARPMHPEWVRSLRGQCAEAGVPFFFKQWGEWLPMFDQPWELQPKGNCQIINLEGGQGFHGAGAMWTKRTGKKRAGRTLDGREWNEMPNT